MTLSINGAQRGIDKKVRMEKSLQAANLHRSFSQVALMEKAVKGTPQYDIWLQKHRAAVEAKYGKRDTPLDKLTPEQIAAREERVRNAPIKGSDAHKKWLEKFNLKAGVQARGTPGPLSQIAAAEQTPAPVTTPVAPRPAPATAPVAPSPSLVAKPAPAPVAAPAAAPEPEIDFPVEPVPVDAEGADTRIVGTGVHTGAVREPVVTRMDPTSGEKIYAGRGPRPRKPGEIRVWNPNIGRRGKIWGNAEGEDVKQPLSASEPAPTEPAKPAESQTPATQDQPFSPRYLSYLEKLKTKDKQSRRGLPLRNENAEGADFPIPPTRIDANKLPKMSPEEEKMELQNIVEEQQQKGDKPRYIPDMPRDTCKATKGTPQYEQWLEQFRAKHPESALAVGMEAGSKDALDEEARTRAVRGTVPTRFKKPEAKKPELKKPEAPKSPKASKSPS